MAAAESVATNFFHGCIFALLNNKPFACVGSAYRSNKLRGLTDPYLWFAYRIGVLLVLAKGKVKTSDVYLGGIIDRELSDWFAGRLKELGLA